MEHLAQSVKDGVVTERQVDIAVRRILEMKFRLGLFEDPYRYSNAAREKAEIYKAEHLAAARDIARKSIALLKNDTDILPLSNAIKSIAVIGPLADSKTDMLGSWISAGDRKEKPVTVLEGLRARYRKDVDINYAKGAHYRPQEKYSAEEIRRAVALANESDIIIAVLGERWSYTGEAASRTDLQLPGNQQALLEALHATGKPIVLVLMNGRPLALEWADQNVGAIVEAWYPGIEGGHAIADILSGDYNPSGKLPVTIPRNVGQIPLYYNMLNTGRPQNPEDLGSKFVSRYLETPNTPLYAFGHGLSYTEFKYSDIALSSDEMAMDGNLTASVTITNTGKYAGTETVQLYIQDLVGSVARPVKELKGFKQITLAPGEPRAVNFTITPKELAFYRLDMSYGAEPGAFKIYIGGASDDVKMAAFTLVE